MSHSPRPRDEVHAQGARSVLYVSRVHLRVLGAFPDEMLDASFVAVEGGPHDRRPAHLQTHAAHARGVSGGREVGQSRVCSTRQGRVRQYTGEGGGEGKGQKRLRFDDAAPDEGDGGGR